jgi:cysteinyl-tRNA synthetase
MKIFNSLHNKIEDFKPLNEGKVGLYSCGPTVYNSLHIGNLSAFIYADVLHRALTANGYEVFHVMNITDVDDKTIRDSKKDYPDDDPQTALKKLTDKYTKIFKNDLVATKNDVESITFISAVETIDEMVELTQKLIDKGIGYIADDGIYFSIKAYQETGNVYGYLQKVEISKTQSRIANDEYDKENVYDFALWKATTPGEPSWNAEFDVNGEKIVMPGRPGWHIECSAMSEKLLGVPFDIHTGGIDLKFPHHENEIAQTRGSGSKGLSNYFFHNNHLLVDGAKMSKSLGNFYTLRDIETRGIDPQAFRLLVLESHYRTESNFSWEILEAAKNRLKNWLSVADRMYQLPENSNLEIIKKMTNALSNDLNTSKVLVNINNYFDDVISLGESPNKQVILAIKNLVGIDLITDDITESQKEILKERLSVREVKDWAKSDELRDTLKAQGIGINDTQNTQIWYRISGF